MGQKRRSPLPPTSPKMKQEVHVYHSRTPQRRRQTPDPEAEAALQSKRDENRNTAGTIDTEMEMNPEEDRAQRQGGHHPCQGTGCSSPGGSLCSRIPPSPCATTTSSVATNSPTPPSHMNINADLNMNVSRNVKTSRDYHSPAKMTIPSPSRPTIDPEYARRLYSSSQYQQHQYQQQQQQLLNQSQGETSIEMGQDGMIVVDDDIHTASNPAFFTPDTSFTSANLDESMEDIDAIVNNITSTTTTTTATTTPSSSNFYTPERMSSTSAIGSRKFMDSYSSFSSHHHHRNTYEGYTPKNTHAQNYYTPQRSPTKNQHKFRNHLLEGNLSPSSCTQRRRIKNAKNDLVNSCESTYSDRFIPSRVTSNLRFSVWDEEEKEGNHHHGMENNNGSNSNNRVNNSDSNGNNANGNGGVDGTEGEMGAAAAAADGSNTNTANQSTQPSPMLDLLLRSELLGENIDPSSHNPNANAMGGSNSLPNSSTSSNPARSPLREGANFFRFNQSPRQTYLKEVLTSPTSVVESFNLSPVGAASSNRLMAMPQKRKRRIAKVPFKVLDAPQLADDFYLNLVDWSSLNVLAVGLGSCVYLWSACTSQVTKLCDLGSHSQDAITSVAWTQRGTHLAVGVNNGEIQIWDTVKCKKIRTMTGHNARIGALSWSGPTLASGSRDRLIYLRDVRVQQPFTAKLAAHKQEVCGLKWSFVEPAHLASGGNDNKLLVWDIKMHRQPTHRFAEHTAAVKAIAWSPHQHGLLASGGGTADRCIRFWNALSGSAINAIDTGSQVCNLAWSQNCNEIVSTHGYSLNQIAIWKYPNMQKVATLTGHTYRVLYLAMSPDGSTIVTGAGDETLRFWQVFPGPRSHGKNAGNGILFPSSPGSILR